MLAEITAVLRIVPKSLNIQLLRLTDDMPDLIFSQNSFASFNSRFGNEQEDAVTAITFSLPSVSSAAFNRNVESTPLENATVTLPSSFK